MDILKALCAVNKIQGRIVSSKNVCHEKACKL